MDATQKRRMWKVAIIHFCLTLLVIASLFNSGWSGRSGTKAEETWMIKETLKIGSLILLQPQLGILFVAAKYFPTTMTNYFSWVRPWLLMTVWFISIPVWSYYFGWIFIRVKDWLNHFPALGKRVF